MTRHVVSITADILVFNQHQDVLVIKRKNPPFQGQWAFPGGYVDKGETFLEAAVREAQEETGLVLHPLTFAPISIRDDVDRDPRGRVISQPFVVMLDFTPDVVPADDAVDYMWLKSYDEDTELAFDHRLILEETKYYYIA